MNQPVTKHDVGRHQAGYWTKVGQFSFGFNMPGPVAKGQLGLPPYHGRRLYLVDKYPACPSNWLRSQGRLISLFVPIVPGQAAWLDFNGCNSCPTDVAVVVSVQGVNPLTLRPCTDAQLEQYVDRCPTHNVPFGAHRFCHQCGFKWPRQNYLATTGTPNGAFWLDGFRRPDGTVSQYLLSTDTSRVGVAEAVLGTQRVHALGLSFFMSKHPKPTAVAPERDGCIGFTSFGSDSEGLSPKGSVSYSGTISYKTSKPRGPAFLSKGVAAAAEISCSVAETSAPSAPSAPGNSQWRRSVQEVTPTQVEVMPGETIDQQVYDDPQPLSYWQDQPEVVVVLNYCTEADADMILAGGTADVEGDAAGALGKLGIKLGT